AAFLVLLVAVAATRAGGQAPGWRVVLAADALLAARAVFYFLLVPAARGALRRPGGDGGRARRPSFGVAALLPVLVLVSARRLDDEPVAALAAADRLADRVLGQGVGIAALGAAGRDRHGAVSRAEAS